MRYLFAICLLICCFCNKKKTEETQPSPCCVPTYDTFIGSFCKTDSVYARLSEGTLSVDLVPTRIYDNTTRRDSFLLYSRKYNDINYNQIGQMFRIIADTLANITVITKFDLDNTHKAGDTINNLINIKYRMVYDYIQSRYNSSVPIEYNTSLREFNNKNKILFDAKETTFQLPSLNPKPAKQQYEVRIRFTSGKIISDTTELITN